MCIYIYIYIHTYMYVSIYAELCEPSSLDFLCGYCAVFTTKLILSFNFVQIAKIPEMSLVFKV